MTFDEFCTVVRVNAFPEGEAENLVSLHTTWIKDALIDLQQKVKCLRYRHVDSYLQSDTMWNCGATVFEAPRGFVSRIKVIGSNCCDSITYTPSTKLDIENAIADGGCGCGVTMPYDMYYLYETYYEYPDLGYCNMYANDSTDTACRDRSGLVTIHEDNNVWMYPAIQSDETVVVEWNGIKREWSSADLMGTWYDREVQAAVELYLEYMAARKEDADSNEYKVARAEYADKVAQLIWQCNQEKRIPKQPFTPSDCPIGYAGTAFSSGTDGGSLSSSDSLYSNDLTSYTAECC